MRKNHTEIVCIVDRSGSMASIKTDAEGGFDSFIVEQKKVKGTASVTLVLFDDKYEVAYQDKDLKNVPLLNLVPRGNTALLDAIGRTINEVGSRLASTAEKDRPGKVMVCIVTDGQENASKEFTKTKIKEMIDHQRSKYSWEFSYLGANQDAFAEANQIGIVFANNFAPTGKGVRTAYAQSSSFTADYRNS
jgi:uncharacterized protein YegL